MKCVDEIPVTELRGKRVFLRTGLNLPVTADGSVSDIFRLKRGLPTIEYLSQHGARTVIVGYLGRKGDSMRPVAEALMRLAPHIPIRFLGSSFEQSVDEAKALKDGECLLLESTRRDPREEENDPAFIALLASMGDIFVSDALPEAHRNYASNVGVGKLLPAYAGLLMRDEVKALTIARTPEHPSFAILGGAKFETKAPLIAALLEAYDHVFITGALANDVFKARGLGVGVSLVSTELPSADVLNHPHFIAPIDVTVEGPDKQARVKKPEDVESDEKIVDIGPDTVAHIAPLLLEARCILWNGPTGLYEDGFVHWTHRIAELIGKNVAEGGTAVIGGGDTIAAIQDSGVKEQHLGFLSTGGGAMLEFLLKGTLPGIEVLG